MFSRRGQPGQIMILGIVFMGIIALAAVSLVEYEGAFVSKVKRETRREKALALAEAGVNRAVAMMNQTAGDYSGETLAFGNGEVVISIQEYYDVKNKLIEAVAYLPNQIAPVARRRVTVPVSSEPPSEEVFFHYGVQIGAGGLEMAMNTHVDGNIYSNGPVVGADNEKSTISGDAWAAGELGSLKKVGIGNDAHARLIEDSRVAGNAYYQILQDTDVAGALYPDSPDPEMQPFPVADSVIAGWQRAAAAGGVINGDYRPEEEIVTLGPKKITGNLIIDNGQTLILTGTVWVEGYISISNNGAIRLDAGYGRYSGVILTDKYISLDNNGVFGGSGSISSFLMMLSMGNCLGGTQTPDCGPGNSAIYLKNNVDSTVFYAPRGLVHLNNRVVIKEATAYKLYLANNAEVIYDSGLGSAIFSSGPSGAWQALRGAWQEGP